MVNAPVISSLPPHALFPPNGQTDATFPEREQYLRAREDERSWLTISKASHIPRDG